MKELSEKLDITPSTCSRFVSALEGEGIVYRKTEWKTSYLYLTEKGKEKEQAVELAQTEFIAYCESILGKEFCASLAADMTNASDQLVNRTAKQTK